MEKIHYKWPIFNSYVKLPEGSGSSKRTSSSGTDLEAVETSQPQSRRVVLGRGMKKSWSSPSRRSFQAQHLLEKAGKIPAGCGKGLEIYRKLLGFLYPKIRILVGTSFELGNLRIKHHEEWRCHY